MKVMKWLIPVLIATLSMACSKVDNIEKVELDFSDLKKEVSGSWIETGDCEGCRQVEFSSDELTVHYLEGDIVETMPFSFISKDSI